jgi:glutathione-regulated potassium-efflux system protein KefB
VVPPALDRLARQGNREGFLLVVMLAVFLAAWAMHEAGMSMALGAFLMGMLLSNSQYNLQIQSLIEPHKGLLMSLFFVAVGMSIDLGALGRHPFVFAQHVGVFILIKLAVLLLLGLAFGLARPVIVRMSFLLAQGGEFGFVLLGAAKALAVVDDATFILGIGVISVSMLVTPLLVRLGDLLATRLERPVPAPEGSRYRPQPGETEARVILAGYGRVGHTVAVLLHSSGVPFIAFDRDPARVARGQADGFPVYYGDIASAELLAAAQLERASLLVLAIDDGQAALRAVAHLRNLCPRVPVIARARDLEASGELLQAGAIQAFPELVESGVQLAANALQRVGVPGQHVDRLLHGVRDTNYALVRESPEDAAGG